MMPRHDRRGNPLYNAEEVLDEIYADSDSADEPDGSDSDDSDGDIENSPQPTTSSQASARGGRGRSKRRVAVGRRMRGRGRARGRGRQSVRVTHTVLAEINNIDVGGAGDAGLNAGDVDARAVDDGVDGDGVDGDGVDRDGVDGDGVDSDGVDGDGVDGDGVDANNNQRKKRPDYLWVPADRGNPEIHHFTGTPGIQVDVEQFTPYDFYKLYLTEDLLQIFVEQTNLYADQYLESNPNLPQFSRSKKWTPTEVAEMKKFIGLSLLMGLIKKNDINSYWSTDPLLRTPVFGNVMPRDRYLLILKFFHLVDNTNRQPDADRLYKLQPLLEHLSSKFQSVYKPGQHISVDESLLLYKGRLFFRQYIPLKRSRFGIKIYLCCEDSGYTYRFRVYQGKEDPVRNLDVDLPDDTRKMLISEKVALWLVLPLLQEGYQVYMDNWYSSPRLYEYLHSKGTMACGTLRKNRAPAQLRNLKLQKGQTHALRTGRRLEILSLKWQDKKEVYVLSTIHGHGMRQPQRQGRQPVQKPECVVDYNKHMGGVDRQDQIIHAYDCTRKSYKWYKKLSFHLLQVALLNAFIVAKAAGYRKTFLQFQIEVIAAMVMPEDHPAQDDHDDDVRLSGRHFPDQLPPASAQRPRPARRCRVCYRKDHVRRESRWICPDCPSKPGLCMPSCFKAYHTKRNYWQE